MPQSHLALNERKHRLEPRIFRQPAADQLRAPALIISDGQIETHRYLTRGKLLTVFESQRFADLLYNDFEFVISSQLTDCARRINSVGRKAGQQLVALRQIVGKIPATCGIVQRPGKGVQQFQMTVERFRLGTARQRSRAACAFGTRRAARALDAPPARVGARRRARSRATGGRSAAGGRGCSRATGRPCVAAGLASA